ncbi:Gfo/Idh/MocA family protein [Curvivirga sp.]|uniref:Gfo/Idh/MocA family protein n=1 Tax=Curvivirga sp. TaxID=2856848 RepID=UPI003B5C9EC8
MTTSKIRLVTVGAGYFSRFQYSAWHKIPEVDLVAICNRTKDAAKEIADQYSIPQIYTDFEEMLDQEKPDLVDIITPPHTHDAYVRAAVERGVKVICQKPFTQSLEEAKDLTDFIQEKNGTVVIHENFRFQPWYLKIKDILSDGSLGEIYQIKFNLRPGDGQGKDAYLDRQPYFQQMEKFLIHETAVHLIDVFRYLLGEVKNLYADLRRVNPVIKGEDAGIVLFEFENGSRGIFDGNRNSDHSASNRRLTMGELVIEAEHKTIFLNGDGKIFIRETGSNLFQEIPYEWENTDFGGNCVFNLQKHIINCLINGDEIVNTATEYLKNVQITDLVYKSNDKKRQIDVVF